MVEKLEKSDIKRVKLNYLTRISAPKVNHKAIRDIIQNLKLEQSKIKTEEGISKFFNSKIVPSPDSFIAKKEKEEFHDFKRRKLKKKFQKEIKTTRTTKRTRITKRTRKIISLFLEKDVSRINDYSGVITEEN